MHTGHRPRQRRVIVGIALGAGVAVIVGALLAFKLISGSATTNKQADKKGDKTPVALEFKPSEIALPVMASVPLTVEFSGPLVAPRTAIVRAKASGTLLSLSVNEGSRVRAGQVLGEIDLSDLQSRVSDRAAMVESAEANMIEAERQNTANTGLAAQNFISATALQSSQAKLDAARAQLKSSQAQLSTSRLGVRDAGLVAPISGIVGKRSVVPGEKVSAEQPLITVVDLSMLELVGSVGTHEVSLLAPGQSVKVKVEGSDTIVTGRIDRISPSAEAGTRAIGVVVVLDNKGEQFRAGQYAQAVVQLNDDKPRLTIPSSAIGQASGQDYVWTLEKGALVRRIVITGRADKSTGRVEVTQGIAPGTQVLAVRFDNLKEGAPAVVVARSPSAASAPAAVVTKT